MEESCATYNPCPGHFVNESRRVYQLSLVLPEAFPGGDKFWTKATAKEKQ